MAGLQRENPPYWPGGIPAHIRCHDQPIPWEQIDNEIQGWLLFLDENTVPRPVDGPPGDDDYELQQRRRLMSQWASMNQADRETYQARGSAAHLRRRRRDWRPPPGCFTAGHLQDPTSVMARAVNCIVPQPLEARDRAVFTKLRIMLYRLDGEEGPLIDDGHVSVCVPNPESDNAGCGLNPDREFLMWHYVENADFHFISMTSAGTVVFYSTGGPRVLVDRQALDTGRVLLCDFETNGQLEGSCRIRPYILYDFWPLIVGLGKTVRGVMDREVWKSPTFNGPLNMDQLIVDILEDCKPGLEGGIDEWMEDIEKYAPGYLDLEEAGQEAEFDHSNFKNEYYLTGS